MLNPEIPAAPSLWSSPQFRSYLASTAFSGGALSMQQFLISWMLVGMLVLPGDQVGMIQAVIGIPGIFLMLWGGASADRSDPRLLLLRIYAVSWVIPLLLATCIELDHFNVWTVMAFGLGISTVTAFSSPAQQAILNRVANGDIQRAVTASTAIGFLVQIIALVFAGQMERFGMTTVLLVQAACIAMGAFTIARLGKVEQPLTVVREPTWRVILDGMGATYARISRLADMSGPDTWWPCAARRLSPRCYSPRAASAGTVARHSSIASSVPWRGGAGQSGA